MDLLIETDLGHDPDDLFAICWLAALGHKILALSIVPGAPDQIRLGQMIRRHIGQDFPVLGSKADPKPEFATGVHKDLLDHYGSGDGKKDGGTGAFVTLADKHRETQFFIIGPCPAVGLYCAHEKDQSRRHGFMQGGFLPYHYHGHPCVRLPQFEGKESVPTFNLNGDRNAADAYIRANFASRRWAGKNVCHAVYFDRGKADRLAPNNHPAAEMFALAAKLYLERHEGKKFHDPTAAALMVCPEIGKWVKGRPAKLKDGWTTDLSGHDDVLADLDHELLWDYLLNWGRDEAGRVRGHPDSD